MCGICGVILKKKGTPLEAAKGGAVKSMIAAMRHRGPDGSGTFERPQVALGHARLSVIDIEGGAQPILDPSGQVALTFNGEIYGYQELRRQQAREGWEFQTHTDSETILAGYCQKGGAVDAKLNGMYAYAIYDGRGENPSVWLSIDPVGIKPLFIFEDDEIFLFASELRAVAAGLRYLGREVAISSEATASFLRNRYVKPPLALLRGVRKLRPGERWRIDLPSGKAQQQSRQLRPSRPEQIWNPEELQATLREALRDAVARQLVSDVPVGLFLSGGIDSSLILAVARELGVSLASFTIDFQNNSGQAEVESEAAVAKEVAQYCGSPFHQIGITPGALMANLDDCFNAMDQPLADPACLPLYALAGFARQNVTVALSGDGGDELFGGYRRHQLASARERWMQLPSAFRRSSASLMGMLPAADGGKLSRSFKKMRSGFELLNAKNYIAPVFDIPEVGGENGSWLDVPQNSDASSLLDADMDGQLAGQMLPKTDAMTMAHSLECRVPLLDLELVELASSLPASQKFNLRSGKLPLRELLQAYLPPSITERRKSGFRVPIDRWFRHDLEDMVRERLDGDLGILHETISAVEVKRLIDNHVEGFADNSIKLWSLLAIQSWQANILSEKAA